MNKPSIPLNSIFPLHNYDQDITHWIEADTEDYDTPLLTQHQQSIKLAEWYQHYFGELSPWSFTYVQSILTAQAPTDLKTEIQQKLIEFDNSKKSANKIGYGANLMPYTEAWITQLKENINLTQFSSLNYDASQRAITVENIMGRVLPTHEVHFYSQDLAGQGYPFDNLQASVIWAGTPVYVIGQTADHAWSMVLTPAFVAWVKSTDIAKTDENFIKTWQQQAKQQLIAIAKTNIPIHDVTSQLYQFSGYIGMVLPGTVEKEQFRLLIPVSNEKREAQIRTAVINLDQGVVAPLKPTPRNFVKIIKELIGRPYGWGSMYFYNDCASELKNLYTPFGIWLPIHSSDQANQDYYLVKNVDLSSASLNSRIEYLKQHGHKFMTIVYIGNHVFLYMGNLKNPKDPQGKTTVLSYQNIWGLKPKNATIKTDRRAIIGKAVLLPILEQYPEDPDLASLAEKKYFRLIYIDQIPDHAPLALKHLSIQALLSP